MKKLLLTFLLPLIALSSVSYGEEINSLFGITLNDNAENYVASSYIDSNKVKNRETIEDYFDLNITDKITTKSPYASDYKITIDKDNIVHMIYGDDDVVNLDICLEIHKDLLSALEEKYQIDFGYFEESYPSFRKYLNYHWTSSGVFGIQCRETYEDSSSSRQIFFMTTVLRDAHDDFYDSGL